VSAATVDGVKIHSASPRRKDGKFSMDLFARAVEAVRAGAGTDTIVLEATA
jgi:hypothetical protein